MTKWSKVVEELLKVGVRNLEEFRFLFEDEAKVGAFVAKIGLGDEATIQTARLRRAWTATRVYFSQVEQDRSKVALADLDSLLEESELRDAKQAFWRRYRLRFPAEVHPSDAVVSRVSRELSKRMLCLFNVWKVRSLQFQLGTSQKKRRLGDGLFTEEAETEESYTADCDTYLNKLHTLLIAYSLAGCQPIRVSPTPPRSRPWGRTRPSTWRSRWTPCFSTSTERSGLYQGYRSTSVLLGCRRVTQTKGPSG